MTKRNWAVGVSVLLISGSILVSVHATLGYVVSVALGHANILLRAQAIRNWLTKPDTSDALKQQLILSQQMRDFAVSMLLLPNNQSYRRYVDLNRPYVIWNVVAAEPLNLQLKSWCYIGLGCMKYRGYFDPSKASIAAEKLRREGLDVWVYGVLAYSTLGILSFDWLSDPLLNTFLNQSEGQLAALMFHELAHQVAYAKDDTVFNESFATAVERIGSSLWLQQHSTLQAQQAHKELMLRRADFLTLTLHYKKALEALYATQVSPGEKLIQKKAILEQMQAQYQQLKQDSWGGYSGFDKWFRQTNNAAFGILVAYTQHVSAFESLFEQEGRNFERFYAQTKRLAALPKEKRHAILQQLGSDNTTLGSL